jgi:Spy/CpxP family protein refolding chaperone
MRTAIDVLVHERITKMTNAKTTTRYRYLTVLGIFTLLASLAYFASDVRADVRKGSGYGHGGARRDFVGMALNGLMRHQKELGLSEEQDGKIKTIATDYKKTRIQKVADVKLAELDVQTRIHDQKADLPSIEAAMRKSETARTALRLEGVKAFRAAMTVLTPEQKEKWHQIMEGREGAGRGKGSMERYRMNPHDQPMREG